MVGIHADIETCFEVDPELIERTLAPPAPGVSPQDRVLALLERMTAVARPRQGAARMLLVFARLGACDWLKADLVVVLAPHGQRTIITLSLDDLHGRRPLHAPFDVDAPLEEFVRTLERKPLDLATLELVRADPQTHAIELHARAALTRETLRAPDDETEDVAATSTKRQPPPVPSRGTRGEVSAKPTMKIPVVHIPREAFRDDEDQPPRSRIFQAPPRSAPEHADAPPATARSAASNVDDIDEGWD